MVLSTAVFFFLFPFPFLWNLTLYFLWFDFLFGFGLCSVIQLSFFFGFSSFFLNKWHTWGEISDEFGGWGSRSVTVFRRNSNVTFVSCPSLVWFPFRRDKINVFCRLFHPQVKFLKFRLFFHSLKWWPQKVKILLLTCWTSTLCIFVVFPFLSLFIFAIEVISNKYSTSAEQLYEYIYKKTWVWKKRI